MKKIIENHFHEVLKHLYINPLEKCNLRCKICYTRKTDPILEEKETLEFIGRYRKALFSLTKSSIPNFSGKLADKIFLHQGLETITFCGGEVFTLPYFTGLVNKLTESMHLSDSATTFSEGPAARHTKNLGKFIKRISSDCSAISPNFQCTWLASPTRNFDKESQGVFVQIITNGTIDRLDEFANPNMVNLIVSIDGLPEYHDKNRGIGNFDKSIKFLKKAIKLGFHSEIFSIVTRQNIGRIEEFENYLKDILGYDISITYHPRKPPAYLLHHPISNIKGVVEGFDFLNRDDLITLMRNRKTFPPKNLGCFQIALASDGKVYGCCEGTVPIGKIDDKIEDLFDRLKARLEIWDKKNKIGKCLGCSQPDFVCGLKNIIAHI